MLKIRQGVANDTATLSNIAFRSKAYWGYDADFMEACRGELTYDANHLPATYFGVLEDPMVIGFYALDIKTKDTMELSALFVEPEFIGRGYGKALMNHAKIQAKVFGASAIEVQADPNALAFYQAMGGIENGKRESSSIAGRLLPVLLFEL